MIHMFDKLADHLIESDSIKQEDKELYTYGLQQGFLIIINILSTILVGLVFHMVWQSIVFMLVYIPLRSYAGGYHAKTQINCYLLSVMLTVLMLLTLKIIPWNNFIIFWMAFVAGITILILAPVEDSNKPLTHVEVLVYRKYSRIILAFELLLLTIAIILDQKDIASCISISHLILGGALVLGKIKNKRILE